VNGLVRAYLNDQLNGLEKDRRTAEVLLSVLITKHGTRKVVIESELLDQLSVGAPRRESSARGVLDRLVTRTRLVKRDYNRGATTCEIVSEFLVPWIRELKQSNTERAFEKRVLIWVGAIVADWCSQAACYRGGEYHSPLQRPERNVSCAMPRPPVTRRTREPRKRKRTVTTL
jgi:hypothetical protein